MDATIDNMGNLPVEAKPVGRPRIWEGEKAEQAKELYLELLAQGYTERELAVVENLPSYEVRWQWLKDEEFSIQCHEARAIGAEFILGNAEEALEDTYQRALDDAASPQLIQATESKMRHARWKASKYNKRMYGDDRENNVNVGIGINVREILADTRRILENEGAV